MSTIVFSFSLLYLSRVIHETGEAKRVKAAPWHVHRFRACALPGLPRLDERAPPRRRLR
jgi:hypothetical protein